MYGVVTALPMIYATRGNDEPPTNTVISKLENYNGNLEYKSIKIKSGLIPLFTNCDNYHSENRNIVLTALNDNIPSFKKWYNEIIEAGTKLNGSFGWYGWRYFYIGFKIKIVFEEGDVECLD